MTYCERKIERRKDIPRLEQAGQYGKQAQRVMRFYETNFAGKPELTVLRVMGLFDRPAERGAIDELKSHAGGLTRGISDVEWTNAEAQLKTLRLLYGRNNKALDCHPLVREHFSEELKASDESIWREAHALLYKYFTRKRVSPRSMEHMEPLLAAVAHGCHAGRYQETYDELYQQRIRRGEEAILTKTLGAFGANLAAVGCFFECLWQKPIPTLRDGTRAFLLNQAGYSLRALGRLRDAIDPIRAALRAYSALGNLKESAVVAGNLSELCLVLGDIEDAIRFARKSVDFADESHLKLQRWTKRTTLADAFHRRGNTNKASELFVEAERLRGKQLSSLWGFRYCDFLLGRNNFNEVLERATAALKVAKRRGRPLDIGLDHLSLARAHHGLRNGFKASPYFDSAVDWLREAGFQEYLVLGLLHRAAARNQCEPDLEEALDITNRCEMQLYAADCHLLSARLCVDAESLGKAKKIIHKIGYRQRNRDVAGLERRLRAVIRKVP